MSTRPTSPSGKSEYPSKLLLTAISNIKRWRIFVEMSSGELTTIKDLARHIGEPVTNTSKHVAVLLRAGILSPGPGGLYRLADRFLPLSEAREMDFGHLLLRIPSRRK